MRTLQRAGAVIAVVLLPLAFVAPSRAQLDADDAIVDGAALSAAAVAVGAFDPDFDFWPVYASTTIDNSLSHGLAGAIWPGFLVDAFFFQYGFQSFERGGLGVSESQYPNPPQSSKASSTGFMRSNAPLGCEILFGSDPSTAATCATYAQQLLSPPGAIGESETTSGPVESAATARGTRFSIPGVFEAAEAISRTSTRFVDGRTVSEATFTARDVTIGGTVRAAKLVATSTAIAGGTAQASDATSKLLVVDATAGDSVVRLDDQGFHVEGDQGSDSLNQALAQQGFEVRLVQGRTSVTEEQVSASTGGLKIRFFRERSEEAFPQLIRQQKDSVCATAAQGPVNQEITRIEQRFPNPLYGSVPLVPEQALPQEVTVNQSVPPPLSCPFINRDTEIAFVIGRTEAASRLTPLPSFGAFGFDAPVNGTVAQPPDGVPVVVPVEGGATTATPTRTTTAPATRTRTVAAAPAVSFVPQRESDVAGALKVVYGGLALLGFLGMGAPALLRKVSGP